MENNKTYIYGLVDKNSPNEIRYVGKSDNPIKRLKRHIQISKFNYKNNKTLTHKDRWLNKINYNVDYVILEECDKNNWQDCEIKYILKYKNLTNTSSGGMGGSGIIYKMSYNEVKEWIVLNLSIESKTKWYEYIKNNELPNCIPRNPREVFLKKGWISWGDFLGTGKIWDNNVNYLNYNDSKKIIKTLNINTGLEYKNFAKNDLIPKNIPNRPERYYKKRGWVSWGDFLGTGRIANQLKNPSRLEGF
jgi:hypothetical protein